MASASSPVVRRSFSLPPSNSKGPSSPDPQVEILYNLPSVRIVAFVTTSTNSARRTSLSYGSPIVEDEPGTLPWVSRAERTIAVGPLRIYRAPGSVAFLSCANALQPILPKSQSWCVDGDSKFVLQIRRPQYWRIEVPNTTAEEKTTIEELKAILSKILLFEKTPCPFQRDFVVELPEAPQTPVKKRPWRPVQGPQTAIAAIRSLNLEDSALVSTTVDSPPTQPLPTSPFRTPTTKRPRNSLQPSTPSLSQFPESQSWAKAQEPEISRLPRSPTVSPGELRYSPSTDEPSGKEEEIRQVNTLAPSPLECLAVQPVCTGGDRLEATDSDSFSDATDDTNITPTTHSAPTFQRLVLDPETKGRPPALQNCSRPITAPPVLSVITSPPSKRRSNSNLTGSTVAESDSGFSSSVDSFHSIQSWHSPLDPPSPESDLSPASSSTHPYPLDDIVLPKRAGARRPADLTISPQTPGAWESPTMPNDEQTESLSSSPPPPTTPPLLVDLSEKSDEERIEAITPSTTKPSLRHRATTSNNSCRRELSPLPPAVNLFSPTRRRPRRLQTARHLPTAIVQKTCEILLSPPSHLLHLMLNIASKIAAGEWRGFLFSGYGEVSWDFEDEYSGGAWAEDDYGISLTPPQAPSRSRKTHATETGGSWEVD
ncbi:uncharacterized protein BP5553_08903 [Venustampulla echinocandica]|uniref:Inheritance of peroxisomes protein 1 n=1 Tax=Venustampulla echinocandica TaxID=2656787 RepID=A0A370TDB6_9HELO|nr:uncharacterized protein BP5553_08903 [Venustampulla echinocandica]RDL32447.1 hypothetical protein BP5553_08903 [Venustampulla echinocandica]